ncbi:MAG: tyrosine--tRNA ligase [Deltaproteobacteria bacterium]|nr:tyrosine--tRNA ligase [Deltaproteobacteria bacterium]
MKNVYDALQERGFIEQVTDEKVRDLLETEEVTCYIGFDPTATSLHVGSLVPIMALAHMQRHGHRPIALIGGGTALIGDPSGKTEMRKVLTREQVNENAQFLKTQLSRYVDFDKGKALLLNNADWLTQLNYIEFLRDIGRHFSVNRMLAAESYKMRLETGLNFIEFNYMLLQSYDFYYLFKHHNCVLQMGGNDQWGNIVAGIDLTRRLEGKPVYGVTFPLITTSIGHKMGKTEKGTVWLDSELTSPYDYFQYWMNSDDRDLERFLALFTFLPMEEIMKVRELIDAELNMAKAVLAFEATKITHSEDAAASAWQASASAFRLKPVDTVLFPSSSIPRVKTEHDISAITSIAKSREELERGLSLINLLSEVDLCTSRGEAKRLITQGGAYVNGVQVRSIDEKIGLSHIDETGEIRLRKGKKKYAIVRVE